jgi:hypothetical protein
MRGIQFHSETYNEQGYEPELSAKDPGSGTRYIVTIRGHNFEDIRERGQTKGKEGRGAFNRSAVGRFAFVDPANHTLVLEVA